MASKATKLVKPLLSLDATEARSRVISLYKACYRQIPRMCATHNVGEFDVRSAREALRNKFENNAHVKDIRVIDMLVIKGQQDLKEVVEHWAQPTHILSRLLVPKFHEKPKEDFMSKFLRGH